MSIGRQQAYAAWANLRASPRGVGLSGGRRRYQKAEKMLPLRGDAATIQDGRPCSVQKRTGGRQ